jgi:DNA-binding NarL/FixJ family response regulator
MIVDDHQLIIDGMKALLLDEGEIQLVGEASNGKEALKLLELIEVDMVLLDIDMPVMNGIEAAQIIRKQWPEIAIIILSMHAEQGLVKNLIEIGANGYLLKNSSREEVVKAIHQVSSGERYFSTEVTLSLLKTGAADHKKGTRIHLTDRESEILTLIAEGFTNKEIGDQLFISHRTVDTHRTNLMKKLEVNNLAGLISFALKNGFVK